MNIRFKPPISGIYANIKSLFGEDGNADKEGMPLDHAEDGKLLYKEDIIANVLEELERRKQERGTLEQQWTLNANFLVGNQYCEINPYRGDIEQLEPVYDWMEREAFNNIAPLIETRIATLKKISYVMKVKPATNELSDYEKAEVSTDILQHIQKSTDFESKKDTAIWWNELCGNCFWLSWWDKDKGEEYAREKITTFTKDGMETEEEKVYYRGELDYGLVTPYEVYPEKMFCQTIEAQRSIILEQVKTTDEIYDLYGIKTEGRTVETFDLTPLPSGGGFGYEATAFAIGHRSVDNAEKVITYFERPSKHKPGGRLIIIVGDTNLVYYGDLPYKKIPLVQMVALEVPGQFFGKSVIERLIPLQRDLNSCINRIHEYIKRIAIGSYLAEEDSVDIEEYEQNGQAPGAFLVYTRGSSPPIPIPNGNLPQEVMNERYNLKNDMEYAAGVSQLMVTGAAPAGVTSGTAISNLMEIDNTRLSLTGDNIRNAIRKLAITWLEICKRHSCTRRVVNFTGSNNIGKVLAWSADDINSFDVEYTTENELLMSEDMQKQRFFEAYNLGLFTDANGRIPQRVKQRALEFMRIGNYSDIMGINLLHNQAAERENLFFSRGVVPKVTDIDEHDIHIEEHMRYVLQMDFYILKTKKPEWAEVMLNHIKEHKAKIAEEEQKMMLQALPQMGN